MSSGFLNILKPCGLTSHDVVNRVRRIFQTRAVGHMGTLDPEAAGVLPLAVGPATRLIPFVEGDTKVYRAEVIFGISTDTYDSHGKILSRGDGTVLSSERVVDALRQFEGNLMQVPPMYSAIKVQGKKLYELARQGLEVERVARPVVISRSQLLRFTARDDGLSIALIEVHCSKGTYIRSLCRDLGEVLATPACMGFLLRISSGPFSVLDSVTLDELEKTPSLIDIASLLGHLPQVELTKDEAYRFVNGASLRSTRQEGLLVVFCNSTFLGLAKTSGDSLAPFKVLAREGDI